MGQLVQGTLAKNSIHQELPAVMNAFLIVHVHLTNPSMLDMLMDWIGVLLIIQSVSLYLPFHQTRPKIQTHLGLLVHPLPTL